ncbi:MAG: SRPBCC domain-containing protein [Bryobacterales bacterium]|nr:SRPBCC domain-containing protein [Bryobacterales bacterium]
MTTRMHLHEETFPVAPESMFGLLHTPSAIRAWWGAARVVIVPESGGVWAAAWGDSEDDPEYVAAATIRTFDPPRKMVLSNYLYRSRTGPLPFQADFVTEFDVTPHPQGSVLRVTQDGFPAGPDADGFYAACERGWRDTFAGIRRFLTAQAAAASR